jgi:hypothetical protein
VAPAAHRSGPIKGPLEQVPPRSRANTSLEQVPPRSRANASLERALPRSRVPHKRTGSRTRVRVFNALTRQNCAITRLGITPRRCFANSLGETHPRHYRELCSMAGVSSVTLCRPLPYGQHAAPSKGAGCTLEPFPRESLGSNHDVRPAGAPSPPLLVLCGHPHPCSTTPGTATTTLVLLSTRGRDAATPATVPRTDHCQRLPRARLKTPRPTTTPSPSKPPLFKYQTRRDDKTGARTARTIANSAVLHTIPPHVAKQCDMLVIHPLLGL